MSLSVKTQGGVVGMTASIFVTGLSESDTVTASYGDKTKGAVWNSDENRHEITGIAECGMWTVTATNGEDTITQDVLVDCACNYEIEMSYTTNYLMLYDYGDECEDVTGGWTGNTSDSASASYKKNTDNLYLAKTARAYVRPFFDTNKSVECSGYSGIVAVTSYSMSGMIEGGIYTVGVGYCNIAPANSSQSTKVLKTGPLDMSNDSVIRFAISGDYTDDTRGSASLYALGIVKEDDLTTLCYLAEVSEPNSVSELIADTAKISAILSNQSAVEFMARKCTGEFMAAFVVNSACRSALNSSPFKDIITTNKHWAKFLAMVQ